MKKISKLKESTYTQEEDAKVEAATTLVTRIERRKKAATESTIELLSKEQEASLVEQALAVASHLEIPTASLVKEIAVEDAKKVVEFAKVVQGLSSGKTGDIMKETMKIKREKVGCSEVGISDAATSEAAKIKGNSPSYIISDNVIDLDSSSPSTNIDDIPLNKV